jgi:Glycosyltransferase 61
VFRQIKILLHKAYLQIIYGVAQLLFKIRVFKILKLYIRVVNVLPKLTSYLELTEYADIKELSGPYKIDTMLGPSGIVVVSPKKENEQKKHFKTSIAVKRFLINNAKVYPNTTLIEVNGLRLIDAFQITGDREVRLNDNTILINDNNQLILRRGFEKLKIDKAIHLLDSGGHNYFHFLIELFPKLLMLKEFASDYKGYPVLVNESYRQINNFKFVLDKAGYDNLVFVSPGHIIEVGELIYVNKLWNEPFNLKRGRFLIDDVVYHDYMFHLFNAYIKSLNVKNAHSKDYSKKIMLTRPNDNLRKYNDKEIEAIALAKGFEIVDTGKLSFMEQFSLFRNADYIIGPTGASWTNLIFCKPGTKALCWMVDLWGDVPIFSTLAFKMDVDLEYIMIPAKSKTQHHQDYYLDKNLFEEKLTEMIGSNDH